MLLPVLHVYTQNGRPSTRAALVFFSRKTPPCPAFRGSMRQSHSAAGTGGAIPPKASMYRQRLDNKYAFQSVFIPFCPIVLGIKACAPKELGCFFARGANSFKPSLLLFRIVRPGIGAGMQLFSHLGGIYQVNFQPESCSLGPSSKGVTCVTPMPRLTCTLCVALGPRGGAKWYPRTNSVIEVLGMNPDLWALTRAKRILLVHGMYAVLGGNRQAKKTLALSRDKTRHEP